MKIKTNETTIQKTASRKSKDLPKTKDLSMRGKEGRTQSKRAQSRLTALQDALQDPITHCEGI